MGVRAVRQQLIREGLEPTAAILSTVRWAKTLPLSWPLRRVHCNEDFHASLELACSHSPR